MRTASVAAIIGLATALAMGDVKPDALFGDHMVVQRQAPVKVFGAAEAGEQVTVSLNGKTGKAAAGADGRFLVTLDAQEAGGPYELTVSGKNTVVFKDVLIGDVWVCGGQSNMALPCGAKGDALDKAPGDKSMMRLFTVVARQLADPQLTCGGTWRTTTAESVAEFSNVGFHFGANVQADIKIPVGLIDNSRGGTTNQEWLPHDAYALTDEGKKFLAKWDANIEQERKAWVEYSDAKAAWQAAGQKGAKPRSPHGFCPMTRYNCGVHPLIKFPIKGFAWYQGEWNSGSINGCGPAEYDKFLPLTIEWYRKLWGEPDMAFMIVQLPNYGDGRKRSPTPLYTGWPNSQEVQLKTWLKTPNTGLAVTVDIGGALHTGNKDIVGRRLALAALGVAYGRKIEYSGPIYKSMEIDGSTVRVRFDHIGSGLMARDPETKEEGGPIKGFALAGADQQFQPAAAAIDGSSVVLTCKGVPTPVAVRYAFHQNPQCDLYNKEGLPASPFRTDNWPMPGRKPKAPVPADPQADAADAD